VSRILSKDTYNVKDNIQHPRGWVRVYSKRRNSNVLKLIDKSNLIVYKGRNWLLQRALNTPQIAGSTDPTLWINWLSVGTGGATTTSPFVPIDPQLTDTELANEIVINATDPTLTDGGRKHPFDNITFEQDPDNDNQYLIATINTTLGYDDANGYYLNEAGLVISDSNQPTVASTFELFARCTFSTIEKTNLRELLFVWQLFF